MIDRLLVLRLDIVDCAAEAWLNGVPIARADAACPSLIVPVHEYIVPGLNRLELVLWPRAAAFAQAPAPPPERLIASGKQAARVRMLLPRVGNVADESSARTLAQLDWAPEAGLPYDAQLTLRQEATLQVNFPRWRWLDAPATAPTPVIRQLALSFVQQIARNLSDGDVDAFLSVARLRTEELATAYQRDAADDTARLRAYLLEHITSKKLDWLPMDADGFALRSIADGRLLECLDMSGAPMLRTAPDAAGRCVALPLRLAAVEGKLYVLR